MSKGLWNLFAVLGLTCALGAVVCVAVGCASFGTQRALEETEKARAVAEKTNEEKAIELAGLRSELAARTEDAERFQQTLQEAQATLAIERSKAERDEVKIAALEQASASLSGTLERTVSKAEQLASKMVRLEGEVEAAAEIAATKKEEAQELREQAVFEEKTDREHWFGLAGNLLLGAFGLGGVGGLGRKGMT